MCRIATKTNGLRRELNWHNATQSLSIPSGGGGRTTSVEIDTTFRCYAIFLPLRAAERGADLYTPIATQLRVPIATEITAV